MGKWGLTTRGEMGVCEIPSVFAWFCLSSSSELEPIGRTRRTSHEDVTGRSQRGD